MGHLIERRSLEQRLEKPSAKFLALPGSRALLSSEPLKCTLQILGEKGASAYHALKS